MNPKDFQHSDTQPNNGQEAISPPRRPSTPHRRGWVPWAVGASLVIGAGALSGNTNTCNFINTGTQIILVKQGPP